MLKKIKLPAILALALTVFFITGCHKDPPVSSTVTVSEVRMQITTSSSGVPDTFVYQYDSLGRQVYSKTDTMVTTYSYAAGSVTQDIALAGENFTTLYTTNASGLATSDSKGNIYAYDSLGYLTSQSVTGSTTYDSIVYTISGGDVDTSVRHEVDASGISDIVTTSYTYLPTTDSRNFGMSWLGKANARLVSTETDVQVINGATYTIIYTYSYSFDSRNRVTQMTQTSGSATYTTYYTYY